MSEEKKEFETWAEVIADFLEEKKISEEENYIKDLLKHINKKFGDENYFHSNEVRDFFDNKKYKKEKEQSSIDFQRNKLEKILEFEEIPESVDIEEIKMLYQEKCRGLDRKYAPSEWISKASKDAGSVSFATHVVKLTHSKIDSPSFYDQVSIGMPGILATHDLPEKIIDGAVSGNQFAPVFQFLELELQGNKLASEFAKNDNAALHGFSTDKKTIENWNAGFKMALSDKRISSHFLAKQIYFPIHANCGFNKESYHLLCPIKSSSFAHAVFGKLINEQQKVSKEKRKKGKYCESIVQYFIDGARLSTTKSNHSNASQLNGKRGGKLYLLSTQSPTWQQQFKPPIEKKSLFDYGFAYQCTKTDMDYLREFLIRHQKAELSIKTPERKKWIDGWVNNIIEELFYYIESVQNLSAGWSNNEKIKLKMAHRFLLDPYREDEEFQAARKAEKWESIICDDFANWLNRKLKGKDGKFTPQTMHTRMWKELLAPKLREHNKTTEAIIAFNNKEQA